MKGHNTQQLSYLHSLNVTGYQSGKLKITPSTFCEMLGMNYYLLWLLPVDKNKEFK